MDTDKIRDYFKAAASRPTRTPSEKMYDAIRGYKPPSFFNPAELAAMGPDRNPYSGEDEFLTKKVFGKRASK